MADITYLPAESAAPEPARGRTRLSIIVDLAAVPAISRRRELNVRLLEATCAVDATADQRRFSPDDLDLLLLATRERFGGEGALLRRQAVLALGDIESEDAVRRLTDLALTPVEHDGIRIAALGALPVEYSRDLLDELSQDQSPAVRGYAARVRGDQTPGRRAVPAQVPGDPEQRSDRRCEGCPGC